MGATNNKNPRNLSVSRIFLAEWEGFEPSHSHSFPPDFLKIPIDNGEKSPYIELVKNRPTLGEEEQAVFARLTTEPQEASALMAALDMPSGKVLSILTMLTVKGYAQKHPGGSFSVK